MAMYEGPHDYCDETASRQLNVIIALRRELADAVLLLREVHNEFTPDTLVRVAAFLARETTT